MAIRTYRVTPVDERIWERHNSARTQRRFDTMGGMKGQPCCTVCGRKLNPTTAWTVRIIAGGSSILHPDDIPVYKPDGGDMGRWDLGPECARLVPMEFRSKYQPFEF